MLSDLAYYTRWTMSTMVGALVRNVATLLRICPQLVFSSPAGTSDTTIRAPGCTRSKDGSISFVAR